MQVGTAPRSNPLPFHLPFWQKKDLFRIASVSGGSRGGDWGPCLPLLLDQTEKKFWETAAHQPPPPPTTPPTPTPTSLISRSGSGTNSIEQMPPVSLIYNPGQKFLGQFPFFTCFCVEFAASLRYTFMNVNTALTRFLPHPPWTKLRSLTCARYVKGV